ncbi:hypothetical protein [Sinorhizobium sp. 22678]|uniref:hypothetical protein n=1 Tax=Sinorhizobium sp. 22678 TaxID=3453955 RepID=UPI003F8311B8
MTVVAFFEELQLAIADVLMSADYSNAPLHVPVPISLPSAPAGYPLNINAVPVSLARKILRVKSDVSDAAFLTAGTVSHIKDVARNARQLRSGPLMPSTALPPIDTRRVQSVLEHAMDISEQKARGDFEIIGICDGAWFSRAKNFGTADEIPYFGRVTLAGSGAPALRDWLFERGKQYSELEIGNEPFYHRRHRTGGWLLSRLLEEDVLPQSQTLEAGVGGYYELYEYDPSGMSVVDGALIAFMSIDELEKGKLVFERVFFHTYIDDCLCILALSKPSPSFLVGDRVRIPLSSFSVHILPTIERDSALPHVTPELLVGMVGGANFFSLALSRAQGESFYHQTKRFFGTEHKLMRPSIAGGYVHLNLDQSLLKRFIAKFPKRPAHGTDVVYSS